MEDRRVSKSCHRNSHRKLEPRTAGTASISRAELVYEYSTLFAASLGHRGITVATTIEMVGRTCVCQHVYVCVPVCVCVVCMYVCVCVRSIRVT